MNYYVPPHTTVVQKTSPRKDVRIVFVHKAVTEIAKGAFQNWENLEFVVFEDGSTLKKIGAHAFAGTALREFAAPEELREIGTGAFMNCKSLKEVSLNEGLESIEGARVFYGSGLEKLYIPFSLEKIKKGVFAGCSNPVNV